jgi:hypothetical protein
MDVTKKLFLALLLMLCVSASAYGQDVRPLEQKIADSVRVYLAEWQLERMTPALRVESMECDIMSFRWVQGDGGMIQAFLWAYDTEEAAAARPKEILESSCVPRKEWPLGDNEKPVDGKRYSWNKDMFSDGSTSNQLLKKGKMVILVSGGTSQVVTSFLKLIAAEVPAT